MGGKALKTPTRRLAASQFQALSGQLAEEVSRLFGARTHVVRAYRQKPDFGDLDLIVVREGALAGEMDAPASKTRRNCPVPDTPLIASLREYARRHHARDVYRERNSPVFTFEHRQDACDETGFQVDLILVEPDNFQASCDYFAYNDLGNLVGRLAHQMGCKYGQQGLLMHLNDGTQRMATLTLSKDTAAIHQVLGLDHARFVAGFDTIEEIFDFTMSSQFFHPDLYKLEVASHRARTRDQKRATYRSFLQKCEQVRGDYPAWMDRPAEDYLPWLVQHFPQLPARIEQVWSEQRARQALATWFNGRQVGQWTGVEGPALGQLMTQLREQAGDAATLIAWGPERVREEAIALAQAAAAGATRGPKP